MDIFYIGGTKNGALLGEAIVITNDSLKKDFRIHMKQRGALLSKGRVLGLQFMGLFKGDLFFEVAKHANSMASKLSQGISDLGYKFITDSSTNQIFPILPDSVIKKLEQKYAFYVWAKEGDGLSSIRLVTSWATEENRGDEFIDYLKGIKVE